jgi:hypothetical protein
VRVTGVPAEFIANGAFVGLYALGAAPGAFSFAIEISEANEDLFIDLPTAPGTYEIRAHAGKDPASGVVAGVSIEVTAR